MAKKRTIEQWELGKLFGEHVITGYVDGKRFTAIWRAWCQGRFWVSWHSKGAEEVLIAGDRKWTPELLDLS